MSAPPRPARLPLLPGFCCARHTCPPGCRGVLASSADGGVGHRLECQRGPSCLHPTLGLGLPHSQGPVSAAVQPGLSRQPTPATQSAVK